MIMIIEMLLRLSNSYQSKLENEFWEMIFLTIQDVYEMLFYGVNSHQITV